MVFESQNFFQLFLLIPRYLPLQLSFLSSGFLCPNFFMPYINLDTDCLFTLNIPENSHFHKKINTGMNLGTKILYEVKDLKNL